jgi:hypothetical protein
VIHLKWIIGACLISRWPVVNGCLRVFYYGEDGADLWSVCVS